MLRSATYSLVAYLVFFSGIANSEENDWSANLNLFIGSKHMTDPFFASPETDSHFESGMLFDITPSHWPVSLVVDRFRSHSVETLAYAIATLSNYTAQSRTTETDIGVRKVWKSSSINRIHIGGGLAHIDAEVAEYHRPVFAADLTKNDSDKGIGLWIDLGVYATPVSWFNIGFEARYSHAKVKLLGENISAGGRHGGLIIGLHF